jgi:hypothetical protein
MAYLTSSHNPTSKAFPIAFLTIALGLTQGYASQGQKVRSGKASTIGHCSPAVTGDNNTFYFRYCGNDPAKEKKIIELLNKILSNQGSASTNEKLDELLKIVSKPLQSQSNSGGINVMQGTGGANSPIINSPITIGDVPKRISADEMTMITQALRGAPIKATIAVSADQYSGAVPFVDDIYKAFSDAKWTMKEAGVNRYMGFSAPGQRFQGAVITVKGQPLAPGETVNVSTGEPLTYIAGILDHFHVARTLERKPDVENGLITINFMGGFPSNP